MYAVLIADVVQSKQLLDLSLREEFLAQCRMAIDYINTRLGTEVYYRLILTSGDEVQGMFASTTAAYRAARLLSLALYPLLIRTVIAENPEGTIGAKGTKISASATSLEQDNEAYRQAKIGMDELKKKRTVLGPSLLIVDSETDRKRADRVYTSNTLTEALTALISGQKEAQRELSLFFEVQGLWQASILKQDGGKAELCEAEISYPQLQEAQRYLGACLIWRRSFLEKKRWHDAIAVYQKFLGSEDLRSASMQLSALNKRYYDNKSIAVLFPQLPLQRLSANLGIPLQAVDRTMRTGKLSTITTLDAAWFRLNASREILPVQHAADAIARAAAFVQVGNYREAKHEYEKAIEFAEREYEPGHPTLGKLFSGYAWNLYKLADYAQALKYCWKALTIYEKIFDANHQSMAAIYTVIGMVYHAQNDFLKALEYHQKALAIYEKTSGSNHSDTAAAYNNIGAAYYAQDDFVKALEYYQKALAIYEKTSGSNHPDTAMVDSNIGLIYHAQDDFVKALEYYKKALAIYEKTFGSSHSDTAAVYNNIGEAYQTQGNSEQALEYYQKALAIYEKTSGSNYPDTVTVYTNIGEAYQAQDDFVSALEFYQKALAARESALDADRPAIIKLYGLIAGLYRKLGKPEQALEYYDKIQAVSAQLPEED